MACSWRFVARGVVEEAKRYLQHGLEALDLKTIVAFNRRDGAASHQVLEKSTYGLLAVRTGGHGIGIKPPKVTRLGHQLLRCSTCRSSATKSASSRSCARNAATVEV
jgi:hypothetical protein